MKKRKKLVAIFLSMVFIMQAITVNAESGYASKSMNGNHSYTQYSCELFCLQVRWKAFWGAHGTSSTAWQGAKPFVADSIVHKDVLSCTGFGSINIGAGGSPSGGSVSASVSVSGHTVTYTYSVNNQWRINVDFYYRHSGMYAAWNVSMHTEAVVQLGSSFYSWRN